MREQQRVSDVIDGARDKSKTNREVFHEHIECLKTVIIGWSNMLDANSGEMLQFNLDRLEDIVDFHECRELLSKVLINGHVSAEEKKG